MMMVVCGNRGSVGNGDDTHVIHVYYDDDDDDDVVSRGGRAKARREHMDTLHENAGDSPFGVREKIATEKQSCATHRRRRYTDLNRCVK